jgi:hypothetical protein
MKKFLPLTPIPIRKSQQESSCNSISEAEDEIPNSSTCVLESISANEHCNFRFGDSQFLIQIFLFQ